MANHSVAETIANEEFYMDRMSKAGVPEHLRDGLCRYLVHRLMPGHFLLAVLSNDLYDAMLLADEESRKGLYYLVAFLANYAPASCWGSPAKVELWLRGRL